MEKKLILIFLYSETSALVSLALASFVIGFCLTRMYKKLNNQEPEQIPLEDTNPTNNVMVILHSNNKTAIKELIVTKDWQLNPALRLANSGGYSPQDVAMRRSANKLFFECVLDVELSRPAALVWLKGNIDPDICNAIITDDNYTGKKT